MTVPNLITTLRIILTPVFIIYVITNRMNLAFAVFTLCSLTDGVDGLLARSFNQKSTLGTYLDPVADKLLLVSSFIVLSSIGIIPAWLTVLVISRDILIMLGVLILFLNHVNVNINPSLLSKINTTVQFLTIVLILSKNIVPFGHMEELYKIFFYLTAIFTISSGLHYMHYWFKIMGEERTPNN
jgi:cardiolipin synthase